MGDEIPNANVVRVSLDGDRWAALIGPDLAQGLCGFGATPTAAILDLAGLVSRDRWILDETWRPGRHFTVSPNVLVLSKPPPASFSDWHCTSCSHSVCHRSAAVALAAFALSFGDARFLPESVDA